MTTSGWLPLRRAGERMFPGILFLLLLLAVYADPLFSRRNFGGRDLLGYHLPVEKAIHDAYVRRRLPVWAPEISGGRPLAPNPNAGALYPVRPALSLVSFPVAMRIYPVFHWALAGIGMMVLFSCLGASRAGGWVAAVTYVFCGIGVSEVFYTNLQPGVTLLPWILWAVARRVGSPGRRVLLLSLLFGLDFLAGDVFTIGLALLCALLWIGAEMESRARGRALSSLGLSLALAALLAAPQIVATAFWIPETSRSVIGIKLEEALFFSLSPLRLLEFFVPFPFGSTWSLETSQIWGLPVFRSRPAGMYLTLYAGAFVVVALVAMRRGSTPGARFARAFFLLGLALSVPPSLLPAGWHHLSAPLPLRYPEKFSVALTFSLAILTGLALDRLRQPEPRLRWPLAVGVLFALLAGGSALFPRTAGQASVWVVGADTRLTAVAAEQLPKALAEGGLFWMATLVALDLLRGPAKFAPLAAVFLLSAVPIAANRKIAHTFREEEVFAPTAFVRSLARRDPSGSYRTLGESLYRSNSRLEAAVSESDPTYTEFPRRNWYGHTPLLWKRGMVLNDDFDAGDLSRVESLRRVSRLAARHSSAEVFFGNLALRWGIRFRDQEPLPGYRPFGGDLLQDWDEHAGAFPDIRLLEQWQERLGAVAALNSVSRLRSGEIVIESGRQGAGQGRPGKVTIREKTPERLLLETSAPDPTWLFVLRTYWNYRTVFLDGRPVVVYPAQLAFSAIPIPPGRHRIDWREELPGGETSRWGPVLFVLIAALALLRDHRPRRRAADSRGGNSR